MGDHPQRDRAIEQMLRRGVAAPSSPASPSPRCVDAETFAAWSSGSLSPEATAQVEDHLADCARCQAVLAAFAQTEPPAAVATPWWRQPVRWLVPLATAATAAAIWVAIPPREPSDLPEVAPPTRTDTREPAEMQPFTKPGAPPPVAPRASAGAPPASAAPQSAEPRRESRSAAEEMQQATGAATGEADARLKAERRAAEQRAAAPPSSAPAAAPSAPPPTTPAEESATRDQVASTPLFRVAGPTVAFSAPGAVTRWRIVAGQLQRSATRTDGWQPAPLPSTDLTAGHAPAASVVWVVGRAGAIYVSDDAGASFARVPFISQVDLASVTATDSQAAVVTTTDGRRFQTTDRGLTWLPG